jgi:hypothetical protein
MIAGSMVFFQYPAASLPGLVPALVMMGKGISDSNDYARSEKVLRLLEKKYNLTQVISSREAQDRA